MIDNSRRLAVACGARRAVLRTGCTPVPSTAACNECTSRFCTIAVNANRAMDAHHRQRCTLELVERNSVEACRMHGLVNGKLTGRQLTRPSKIGDLLCRGSIRNKCTCTCCTQT